MLLAQEMTTTPAPWQKRRSSERLHVEDALQHLAGVIQYLKSLGLSNERIKNAVDDHLERQDQVSWNRLRSAKLVFVDMKVS